MDYIYSDTNRLDDPHAYMYSEYQGHALIEAYLENRFAVLREHAPGRSPGLRFSEGEDGKIMAAVLAALLQDAGAGREYTASFRNILQKELPDFLEFATEGVRFPNVEPSIPAFGGESAQTIHTGPTLAAAVMRLSGQNVDPAAGDLLDAFLHRFEISKKLYSCYDADLRGGREGFRDARLYWLLGLALCLHLLRTRRMKYASTLLKCTDLICSLPPGKLREELPVGGLPLLLAAEIACMQKLAEEQGVYAAE